MTTTLNVSIRHVDPSERLSTSEHDVTRASLGASTFHYILLPPNPRDEPLECVRARVCFGPQWIPLKSKSELKLKLPVCYFHETSPFLFQIPLMYQQLLFLFSFLFISFFLLLCGKSSPCSAVRGSNPLSHTVASVSPPHHPSFVACRLCSPAFPLSSSSPRRRHSPASSPSPQCRAAASARVR